MYYDVLKNFKAESKEEKQTIRQITVDVYRTFNTFKLKFLNNKVETGQNKLYNLLKVYALILDPTVGYTQGMNFIAAIILMHVPNEALACQIFTKLLQKDNWARMYICSTPKLFDLINLISSKVEKELPALWAHLFEY